MPAPAPVAASGGETVEPMTAMRRGIAEHMRKSLDTSAHVTSAIEVDMSTVVAIREKLKQEYQASYGVNPTYLTFVARATVETLRDYPWINGEMRGETIVSRNFVNLGVAVELADGKGLIVPVIRNAEGLNLLGIARGIVDLAERSRTKKLLPDDVQGGTFTITNPGGYGTFHGTPVINQPQAAILGTYAVVKRPWVIQDQKGADVIAIRPIMNVTLTYDHRLIDGALAGRFLRDLRERLETWGEERYWRVQTVVPMLAYEDGVSAIEWLCEAFDFTERRGPTSRTAGVDARRTTTSETAPRLPRDSRRRLPESQAPSRGVRSCRPMVTGAVGDRRGARSRRRHRGPRRRAAENGATLLSEIEEDPFGRLYRVEDVEGHRWMFVEAAWRACVGAASAAA